ncbi:MAG: LamG domain-containing protein [Bacteroidota bacterium]
MTLKLTLSICLFILLSVSASGQKDVLFHWSFDDKKEVLDPAYLDDGEYEVPATMESSEGDPYSIYGLGKFVPGVKGSAFKFDGFSSYIEGVPTELDEEEPFLPRSITVESWVSLGAYPWNWAPILTVGKYKVTGFYLGIDSRGRVGFHMSDATSVWHECNSSLTNEGKLGLDLNKWYHIAATYDPSVGIKLYINGELVSIYTDFNFDYGIAYSQVEEGFRLGMNRVDLAPSDPIRDWATYPSKYTLDGIIDEVKIWEGAKSESEISVSFEKLRPENEPSFDKRNFPKVKEIGRFRANYTRLKYYPEWDAIWPVGDFMDVVVQFEDMPAKVVFWRGTRYSPALVTENGKWMVDQSRETAGNWFLSTGNREEFVTGCVEHMSDVQTRSSRVSIIEDNPARKVINWRYLQMDVTFRQIDLPNNTGFGQWGNELYYIYPDGVMVRKVLPGQGGWQETIFLNEPGTRPEDNIELEACTLMNLDGDSRTYSWEEGYPVFNLPDANIQITNLKSEYKPFMIFREGGEFEVFNLEVRPEYSHFPWWNHWPVAQIISDGRSANASDRASHSSLSWGDPGDFDYALYGLTNEGNSKVLQIARSWETPAKVTVSDNVENLGYDHSQRAFLFNRIEDSDITSITLEANNESPILNPAFIIKNHIINDITVVVNGDPLEADLVRYGVEYDIHGVPMSIIWLDLESEQTMNIKIK